MKLLDRIDDDYGVAILLEGEHPASALLDRLNAGDGVAILTMAENPLGVLRAMSVRCGAFVLDGVFSLASVKRIDGQLVLHWWILRGAPS